MTVLVRSSTLIWPRGESAPALFSTVGQVARLGVRDAPRVVDQVAGERLLLVELAPVTLLLLEVREARDADHVVLEHAAEAVGLQDQLERASPRHLVQLQRHLAGDTRVDDDVEARDVGEQPEDVLQVAVLEVEADRRAEVARLTAGLADVALLGSGARRSAPGRGPRLRLWERRHHERFDRRAGRAGAESTGVARGDRGRLRRPQSREGRVRRRRLRSRRTRCARRRRRR